ncbi:MarR family winged helix-turn-helix transcriptional regulator [Rhizobium oryziradicis]|uniref:Transcriptional regulator n=1 Tax=Rhizobium oryziradicis TaxID=1867956 RepID=A0A1Q8ZTH9_9HYPH|nr:MarR family transcriptional regulator [Rhizobium oryziradicis]OLP45304.1 transcriptional regulator [Rhizobium oryziradicis]
MEKKQTPDAVDRILAQWQCERPDLDVTPMGLLGRLGRLHEQLARNIEAVMQSYGLNSSSFDVLATLRRAGSPYQLPPSDLWATMMVTSGTMTNRIDQLEKQGLVQRLPNPQDRRSLLIALTDKGFALIDKAVTGHVANQHRLVSMLPPEQQAALDDLLRQFLAGFEP